MPRWKKQPAEERFWLYVNKNSETECWEWTGCLKGRRYGDLWVDGKKVKSHRFSYELHYGKIPEGLVVMHSCDNTKCVRPDHLTIGTQADNIRDMYTKNRANPSRGTSRYNCKLNEDKILEIREKLASGIRQIDIAQEYKVSQYVISQIKRRKKWAHVN